jgi:selenide,water dikinase
MNNIRLTQYSHGAGCGCKISSNLLTTILKSNLIPVSDNRLLVGNESRDDAAVYDMNNGTAIISTTDFFMPIVDDPLTFGRIAAANALSDVYAMGGEPLLAIAILGWPVDKLSPEIAGMVMDGARQTCTEAGIVIAGGHSIDNPEPLFGLAVTGQVKISQLKRNDKATAGSRLYLTKPLGVGILTTAQKQGKLKEEHAQIAINSMLKLNHIGSALAALPEVTAMTDVTGFGLLGHLSEICRGSHLSARISSRQIPIFNETEEYISMKCIPGGTYRNWESCRSEVHLLNETDKIILCDPQTSGGLLLAVEEYACARVEKILIENGIPAISFGALIEPLDHLIEVN